MRQNHSFLVSEDAISLHLISSIAEMCLFSSAVITTSVSRPIKVNITTMFDFELASSPRNVRRQTKCADSDFEVVFSTLRQ